MTLIKVAERCIVFFDQAENQKYRTVYWLFLLAVNASSERMVVFTTVEDQKKSTNWRSAVSRGCGSGTIRFRIHRPRAIGAALVGILAFWVRIQSN